MEGEQSNLSRHLLSGREDEAHFLWLQPVAEADVSVSLTPSRALTTALLRGFLGA